MSVISTGGGASQPYSSRSVITNSCGCTGTCSCGATLEAESVDYLTCLQQQIPECTDVATKTEATGTFTTVDGKTITVVNGIITSIV